MNYNGYIEAKQFEIDLQYVLCLCAYSEVQKRALVCICFNEALLRAFVSSVVVTQRT